MSNELSMALLTVAFILLFIAVGLVIKQHHAELSDVRARLQAHEELVSNLYDTLSKTVAHVENHQKEIVTLEGLVPMMGSAIRTLEGIFHLVKNLSQTPANFAVEVRPSPPDEPPLPPSEAAKALMAKLGMLANQLEERMQALPTNEDGR